MYEKTCGTYCCKIDSNEDELMSRPEGNSLTMDIKFEKQSPPLYARIPGTAISSISASR